MAQAPVRKNSLIFVVPKEGTVICRAQDRKELSKGSAEAAKTAERVSYDGKNGI